MVPDLFPPDPLHNLLPHGGVVNDYGPVFSAQKAWWFFERLMETVPWRNDETVMFGKRIVTTRKVAWYGNREYSYTYSGTTRLALPWTPELLEMKASVEELSGERYNSCLLNLYHHGGEGMSWHSDDEKELTRHSAIASVSLGAERKFSFKHKQTRETLAVMLKHGSLLVMKGATQGNWLHCLAKTTRVHEPRINLTFRCMRDL